MDLSNCRFKIKIDFDHNYVKDNENIFFQAAFT